MGLTDDEIISVDELRKKVEKLDVMVEGYGREVGRLQNQVEKHWARWDRFRMVKDALSDIFSPLRVLALVSIMLLATGFVFGSIAVFKWAASSGEVDYCYVHYTQPMDGKQAFYDAVGHRPWAINNSLGHYDSMDKAKSSIEAAHCPMR